MGQAASMCRFKGCRYKKNKNSNSNNNCATNNSNNNCATNNSNNNNINCSGLQLRSIEEPQTNQQQHHHHHHHYHHQNQPQQQQQQPQQLLQIHLQNQQQSNHYQQQQQQQGQVGLQTQNSNNRMPSEQGGTGSGLDNSGSRSSVPLQLQMLPSSQQRYDAEYARMEAWMDENPEFVQDYFLRKATRQVVDAWLVSHATLAGNDIVGSPTHNNGQQNCSSRGGSGATTPVRKISAHEFERGGLVKPIVNTIDGTPTFLSIGFHHNHHHHTNNSGCSSSNNHHYGYPYYQNESTMNIQNYSTSSSSGSHNCNLSNSCNNINCHQNIITGALNRPQRLSRNELKHLDEKELIFELVKDICDELDIRSLCHKILQNVSILLNADRGSLFLVQTKCGEQMNSSKKCLVSKLFDVCPKSTIEQMANQHEVRVAWGTGIAGHVAESGEPVNIPDAYKDYRFNREIDSQTGYRTKALLCMPIKDSTGDVIGVAQVMNKLDGESFTENDEQVFASYLQFCGIGLRNAQLYEKSQLEVKRNQVLLDLARMIFEEQSTIEHMVLRILTHMQSLIQCQRVQILLVHEASKGSFSRVFDFEANDLSEDETKSRTSPFESRFPINVGITGHVATTGETVNIPNAYKDSRFDPSVDESLTFKHKSILCMAIKNSLGQIIGVIQLINKFDDLSFTMNDENFVEAFAIFCGMGIHNTHMYEKAIIAMAKQSVTLEVLSYHASASLEDAQKLRQLRVPSSAHFQLHDFKFDDLHLDDDDTLTACLRMFFDLDFVERFHIEYEVLCRWLLSVKKNYRNVTYHNWRHAFNVAQMMFAILTATQWWKIFGEIECLALIIGCLCHDLDHRGTNNSFQIKASSPLARLYSTSTMEHHHFDQCLMILNSPGNQILSNLSSEDYSRVIYVLEDAILSTDLAVYFRKRGPFLNYVEEKPLNYWYDDEPRALLRAMSMTVCDLSAITKPWEIEKRIAELVTSEFFEQGDMEKEKLNITPIDIMNREKEDQLPMMQVGFIESICMPLYEAFAKLSDKLEPLVEGVRNNREHWLELAAKVQNSNKNVGTQSHDDHNDDDNNEKGDDDEGSDNATDSDNSTINQKKSSNNETTKRSKNNNNSSKYSRSQPNNSNNNNNSSSNNNNNNNKNNSSTENITAATNNNCNNFNKLLSYEVLDSNKTMEEINNRKNTQNSANAIRKISLYSSSPPLQQLQQQQQQQQQSLTYNYNIPQNHHHYHHNNNYHNQQQQHQQHQQQQQQINPAKDYNNFYRNCGYTLPEKRYNSNNNSNQNINNIINNTNNNSNNNKNNNNNSSYSKSSIDKKKYSSPPPTSSVGNNYTINGGNTTTESDKIPKIVGKLGNIDTEYLYNKLNGSSIQSNGTSCTISSSCSSSSNNNNNNNKNSCSIVGSIIPPTSIVNQTNYHPKTSMDILYDKSNCKSKLNHLMVSSNNENSNINNKLIHNCSDNSSITASGPLLSTINK